MCLAMDTRENNVTVGAKQGVVEIAFAKKIIKF